jgi:membrane associated rhomboid family serine protease
MMPCPRCRTPLAVGRSANGIAWVCAGCGGRAVTIPVLRRTVDRLALERLWNTAGNGHAAAGCDCPSCARPAREVGLEFGGERFDFDVCARCQLVWFDPSEMEALPRSAPRPRPDDALKPQSRQALARMQVELENERRNLATVSDPPDELWKVWVGAMGMPVVIDGEGAERRPWVTWCLLAAIAIASLLGLHDRDALLGAWGFLALDPLARAGLRWPASVIVHGGLFHLAGNLYFLWMFGAVAEATLGRVKFLVLFALAAIAGHGVHMALTLRPDLPVLGASAALSGVITFCALAVPRLRVGLAWPVLLWRSSPGYRWFRVSMRSAFALWILFQLALGAFELFGPGTGTSYLEQLGGALAGFLFWLPSVLRPSRAGRRAC